MLTLLVMGWLKVSSQNNPTLVQQIYFYIIQYFAIFLKLSIVHIFLSNKCWIYTEEFCIHHHHLQVTAVLTEEHLLHLHIVTYVDVGREGQDR